MALNAHADAVEVLNVEPSQAKNPPKEPLVSSGVGPNCFQNGLNLNSSRGAESPEPTSTLGPLPTSHMLFTASKDTPAQSNPISAGFPKPHFSPPSGGEVPRVPSFVVGNTMTPKVSFPLLARKHLVIKSWKKRARAASGVSGAEQYSGVQTGKRQIEELNGLGVDKNAIKKGRPNGLSEIINNYEKATAGVQPCQGL